MRYLNAQVKPIRGGDAPRSVRARFDAGNVRYLAFDVCELVGGVSAKAQVTKKVCSIVESSDVPLCSGRLSQYSIDIKITN
jgi:hypothetical protein